MADNETVRDSNTEVLNREAAAATPEAGSEARPDHLRDGDMLHDTYRIESVIGKGGLGEVYKAFHVELKTWHAIKIIKPELISNLRVLELPRREAKALYNVRDDAVIGYDGFFRDDKRGLVFLVMEYADGPSLRDRLREHPLSTEEIITLRDRLLQGLASAHGKGVFHRDLSPDNVILPSGRLEGAKLIDFGIAKLTDTDTPTISSANTFTGKYQYAAPEQFGLFNGTVGSYTDIYSLGLLLACAALGTPLDMGHDVPSACAARQRVPDLGQVPPALREQLTAMLQPDPAKRPQSAEAIRQRWPSSGDRPQSWLQRVTHWSRPNSGGPWQGWLRWAGGGLVATLLGLALIYWIIPPTPPDGPSRPLPDIGDIVKLPPEEIFSYAQKFYAEGRLDDGFVLLLTAGDGGHGPAALELGMQYDPVLWGTIATSLTKANAFQARKWYRRASELGVAEADMRLGRLRSWLKEHPESDE